MFKEVDVTYSLCEKLDPVVPPTLHSGHSQLKLCVVCEQNRDKEAQERPKPYISSFEGQGAFTISSLTLSERARASLEL